MTYGHIHPKLKPWTWPHWRNPILIDACSRVRLQDAGLCANNLARDAPLFDSFSTCIVLRNAIFNSRRTSNDESKLFHWPKHTKLPTHTYFTLVMNRITFTLRPSEMLQLLPGALGGRPKHNFREAIIRRHTGGLWCQNVCHDRVGSTAIYCPYDAGIFSSSGKINDHRELGFGCVDRMARAVRWLANVRCAERSVPLGCAISSRPTRIYLPRRK